jgi:hypothetical protein
MTKPSGRPHRTERELRPTATLRFSSGCADVHGTYQQLVRREVVIVEKPMVTRYGMKRFTIVDPDGYNLCFRFREVDCRAFAG